MVMLELLVKPEHVEMLGMLLAIRNAGVPPDCGSALLAEMAAQPPTPADGGGGGGGAPEKPAGGGGWRERLRETKEAARRLKDDAGKGLAAAASTAAARAEGLSNAALNHLLVTTAIYAPMTIQWHRAPTGSSVHFGSF